MKALNSSAARPAELASVRFITSDTLTYLQSGNLYTYELATNAKRLIVDGNAITTMDWSEKRQQFVFIKAKRLFLFDLANNTLLNLSDTLAKLSGHFTAPACDLSIASNENMTQQVNLLENVDAVQWTPDQSALIFRTSNFDHAVGSATGYTKVAKSFCCKASIICQRWPVLNPVSTVLNLPDDLRKGLDAYRGGLIIEKSFLYGIRVVPLHAILPSIIALAFFANRSAWRLCVRCAEQTVIHKTNVHLWRRGNRYDEQSNPPTANDQPGPSPVSRGTNRPRRNHRHAL